ncbi:hypothetical protein D3C77_713930 [compost metagenome]
MSAAAKSVTTCQKSQVSDTTDTMPAGYTCVTRRRMVSISPSLLPRHMTECSVAGTEPPTSSRSESAP